ncbi:helix-turn-helix domain-containing protein [Bacillus sp. DJP31]|uniref:AlbA family DNA-binding domain-containing protein n=1 Tax=Bacillus sp. DJP31 TaxID=3409789 RepID=UPI003BB5E2A4
MIEREKIIRLIEHGYECEYLDFKERQYMKEINNDLIKDIMAMANSNCEGEKFIICGIKDKPNAERTLNGINPDDFIDSSNFQQLILSNIEPDINFDYFPFEYKGFCFGVFRINNNQNKPYMLKKKYKNLNEGLCLIRKGSQHSVATRSDFDRFYLHKGFEIDILEPTLYAVHVNESCARLKVTFRNLTNLPVTIMEGALSIYDQNNRNLSFHPICTFENPQDTEFKISLSPKTEKVGNLFVVFGSTDCLRLYLDEYGTGYESYIFELIVVDTKGNQYVTKVEDATVLAKGDFLWKLERLIKEGTENPYKKSFENVR